MKVLKLILTVLAIFIIFNLSKYNTYEVVYADENVVEVNRKGTIIKFNPLDGYTQKKGDSITLYGDYDFNYSSLAISK